MDTKKFKMGWLLVTFDLPVTEKEERKDASNFRKFLIKDGYQMIQFSVYARPCVTASRQKTHLRRLRTNLPSKGHVRAIYVTRAQWDRSFVIYGTPADKIPSEKIPEQLQIW